MHVTNDQLKNIIVEVVGRFRVPVERPEIIDAVQQYLQANYHWDTDDDLLTPSSASKTKGHVNIDFRISDLKREGRLENLQRNLWGLPRVKLYLGPEVGQPDGDPSDPTCDTVMRAIRARRGQSAFRNALCERYGNQCVITECPVLDVLEAAHIRPYRTNADNGPENGLLLRADVHTLFDLDLLGINPDSLKVQMHPRTGESYALLAGRPLALNGYAVDPAAIAQRWAMFQSRLSNA